MDEFFAGISGFFGDWGWLILTVLGIFVFLGILWFVFVAVLAGRVFRQASRGLDRPRRRR